MTDRLAVFKGLLVSFELTLVSSEEMLPADIFPLMQFSVLAVQSALISLVALGLLMLGHVNSCTTYCLILFI